MSVKKTINERFILAPNANGAELIRSLAKLGVNTVGLTISSARELAELALMRSGVSMKGMPISTQEEVAIIYALLHDKEIKYFTNSRTYADAEQFASAIRLMRSLCREKETEELKTALGKGVFQQKNDALYELFTAYRARKEKDGLYDSIDVIRTAINKATPIEVDVDVLKEFPILPIEEKLVETVSGGAAVSTNISELANLEEKEFEIHSYTEGYGAINEVERIVDYIYENGIKPDQCVIACASPREYAQVLFDVVARYNIPATFGTGIPISNSRPATFFKLISEWDGIGDHSHGYLKRILNSNALDGEKIGKVLKPQVVDEGQDPRPWYFYKKEIARMAGKLHISCDEETNKNRLADLKRVLDKNLNRATSGGESKELRRTKIDSIVFNWVEQLAGELEKGVTTFFGEYARCRKKGDRGRMLDKAAKDYISSCMEGFLKYNPDGKTGDIADELLSKMICRESSREGYLHITSIEGAISVMRKHLFVCGMSAANFPGSPRENHLLLDYDLEQFDGGEQRTSYERIRENMNSLDNLIRNAGNMDAEIMLSYSGYNLDELKKANPSSALISIYERTHPNTDAEAFHKETAKTSFFESNLSESRLIGKAYKEGKKVIAKPYKPKIEVPKGEKSPMKRAWSATAIEKFVHCPRQFLIEDILGLRADEDDDPKRLMEGFATGNIAHAVFEMLGEKGVDKTNKKEFLKWAEEEFDDYFCTRIPTSEALKEEEKARFLNIMSMAFDKEKAWNRKVLSAEKRAEYKHKKSGITLAGFPDRIEEDYPFSLIVDYKTKGEIEHTENNFKTCVQIIVYAWLYEQYLLEKGEKNPKIHSQFKYLRQSREIACEYSDKMKEQLDETLDEMKTAIKNSDFKVFYIRESDRRKGCKYCRERDICDLMQK